MMIWSGFGKGGYTVGVASSDSGKLRGPWTQQAEPLFTEHGGHGMIFKTPFLRQQSRDESLN